MKKIIYQIFVVSVILSISFMGCKKDKFTEEDALNQQISLVNYKDSLDRVRDSLNRHGGIINYTVNVVSAGNSSFSKSTKAGLDSISVTVSQYGKTVTKKTENGQVIFTDLRIGTAAVTVHSDSYTDVNLVVDLTPNPVFPNPTTYAEDTIKGNMYNQVRQATTQIPIFALTGETMSTIKGVVTYETNLLNNEPEVAPNVEVIGVINIDDPTFMANYLTTSPGGYAGVIVKIAYSSTVAKTTTNTNGEYTLKVPSAADGLPIKILVSELAELQTLLLNSKWGTNVYGEQSIRTIFGSDVDGITTTPSKLPRVAAAYVTFDAPTGTANLQPTVAATANAIISESGIETIVVNNPGSGYTQAPIAVVTGGNGKDAQVTPTISNGLINGFNITNAGSGYTSNPTVTLLHHGDPGAGAQATAEVTMGYSVADYVISNPGSGYTSVPTVTVSSSKGSGATATAVMNGYISELTLTSEGSGYTTAPKVEFNNSTSPATTTAIMSTQNPIKEIIVDPNTNTYFDRGTTPVVTIAGHGTGATATATMSNTGRVSSSITLTDAGFYEQGNAPLVTITGDGYGATATAILSNTGSIANTIEVTDGGYYDPSNPPTVTVFGNGSGAVAVPTFNWADSTISSIAITLPGSGYSFAWINITASPYGQNAATNLTIKYPISFINVTDNGQDYTSATVNIGAAPSWGTQATATAKIEVTVESINVTNSGDNYWDDNSTVVSLDGTPFNADLSDILYSMKVKAVTAPVSGIFFTSTPTVTFISQDGNGSGAAATATLEYSIKDIIVNAEGSDYEFSSEFPVTVTISAPQVGTDKATASATKGNGKVKTVKLTDGGSGYTAAPNVTLSGAGYTSEAVISASVSNGSVTGFTVNNAGSGYTSTPNVTILTYKTKATASATAYPTAGQIVAVNITNPGQGYVVAPNVEFQIVNGDGSGTGAAGTAVLDASGRVTSVTITNAGSGYYTAPNVKLVVPNYNLTAEGTANVSTDGQITGVTLTTGGEGYINVPNVTFTASVNGKGTGAKGIATVVNGKVTAVVMENQGSGYLGKNAYTSFGPGADVAGKAFSIYSPSGNIGTNNGFNVEASKTYIIDIDLGTGLRTVNN